MDVLAKAAVAEITKLVEDGAVVLRLEMCRRDSEIQELKRSLKLLEVELCKAQEAATTRATEDKQEQTAAQVPRKGKTAPTSGSAEPSHQTSFKNCEILMLLSHIQPSLLGTT